MPDERVLVCARADDLASHVTGCVGGFQCAGCGVEIVVALSGRKVLEQQPTMKTICLQCGMKAAGDGQVSSIETAPGAVEELIDDITQRHKRHFRN